MEAATIILALLTFIGLWGSLWFKIGKLTAEVKGHNEKLRGIEKQLEQLIIGGKH